MEEKTRKSTKKTEYVMIRNAEARSFVLTFNVAAKGSEGSKRLGTMVTEKIRLTPGVNIIEKDTFARFVRADEVVDGQIAGYEALSVTDLTSSSETPLMLAKKLISSTSNKTHLRKWKELDGRKTIQLEIAKKLEL